MKMLNRILGLTIAGLFCMLIVLQLINVDVRRDEMNTILTLAMTQTQTILEEQVQDDIYGTSTSRKRISSNEEYFQEFVTNFQKLITTNSNYQLELLDADYEKGLLDVNVICRYRNIMGQDKTMEVRKTSIIEAIDNTEEAVPVQKYEITYDLQRGRVVGKNPSYYDEYTSNDIRLINPTKVGYEFIGWTGSNGDVPEKNVIIDVSRKEPLHYVANWRMLTYNVVYDYAGGTEIPENPKTYTIESETFTLVNPTRQYYDFVGWTGSNGSSPQRKVTVTRGHYGDRFYTANWELHKYGINYVLNGGVNTYQNPVNYTVMTPDITLQAPTKYGYNFLGWYEDANFTKPITVIDTSRAQDITIYAKWTPKVANITFKSNNGQNKSVTKTYTVDQQIDRLVFPSDWTKQGYNAVGYTDSQGNLYGLTDFVTTDWIIKHEGNQELNVKWEAKAMTIEFHSNWGSYTSVKKNYVYDGNGKMPTLSEWTRNNYTAQYYSYSDDGGKAFELGSIVPNDLIEQNEGKTIHLYVIWKANILYGYQDATGYSGSPTTSIPADGFYKSGTYRENITWNYDGDTYNPFTYSGGSFIPTKMYTKGYCHTGACNTMEWQGNVGGTWVRLDYGTQGRGDDTNNYYYDGTSSMSQFKQVCRGRGSNGYERWGGSSCVGTAGGWYGYQQDKVKIEGYRNKNGYYAVTSWGDTVQMPNYNSYSKTSSRRLVYSRDEGATWTECANYGSLCPIE